MSERVAELKQLWWLHSRSGDEQGVFLGHLGVLRLFIWRAALQGQQQPG
jgi:hypothetical protein